MNMNVMNNNDNIHINLYYIIKPLVQQLISLLSISPEGTHCIVLKP